MEFSLFEINMLLLYTECYYVVPYILGASINYFGQLSNNQPLTDDFNDVGNFFFINR
jgi:hypothetical protein